jgi:hypothetical protein
VLDFILMDDAWVMDCATALGMAPEQLVAMRQACPAAGCRTGRDRKSACGAGSAGFAGFQRRQQALQLQPLRPR